MSETVTGRADKRQRPAVFALGSLLLGLLYFGVLTPLGLVLRLAGRDPLRLGREPAASSYWVPRPPARRRQTSMRGQS